MIDNNINYVQQCINEEDKENFKKSEILKIDNYYIVITKINDFLIELCDALGMQRL